MKIITTGETFSIAPVKVVEEALVEIAGDADIKSGGTI
jgi:hypothetical protein